MKKEDVLLRADKVLNKLYNEINVEEWGEDDAEYKKRMDDFFIITNILSELIQYRYNKSTSKEEFKKSAIDIIDNFFK